MKRKLKAVKCLKGTPPITKFFKQTSDIKAKPLAAVVAIENISPTKLPITVQQLENNNITRITTNKDLRGPKVVNGFKQKFEVRGLINSSDIRTPGLEKRAKKCLIEQPEFKNHTKGKTDCKSSEKNCTSFSSGVSTRRENEAGVNIQNDCLNNFSSGAKVSKTLKPENESRLAAEKEVDFLRGKETNLPLHTSTESSHLRSMKIPDHKCPSAVKLISPQTDDKDISDVCDVEIKLPVKENFAVENCSFPSENGSTGTVCSETENLFSDSKHCSIDAHEEKEPSEMEVEYGTNHGEVIKTSDSLEDKEDDLVSKDLKTELKKTLDNSEKKNTCEEKSADVTARIGQGRPAISSANNIKNEDETAKCECVTDQSESSDDELFNPVGFLSDNRVIPDVRTPEKSVTPIAGSPLTPISPFVARAKETGPVKYSLERLLSEKPKDIKKDKELQRLQLAIQQAIKIGRNVGEADEDEDEHGDDEETLLPIHKKELEKYKCTDKGFAEEMHGVNIFPGLKQPTKHVNGCSEPLSLKETVDTDDFTRFLYQRSDEEIRELLCSDWITHRYLVRPCPSAVVQWLFHIICYHLHKHTVKAGYNALWSMVNAEDSKEKPRRLSWIPDIQDALNVFSNFGTNITLLLPTVCKSIDIGENLLKLTCENDASADKSDEQDSAFFPLANFTRLIQFMTLCLDRYPERYNTKDIEDFVLLLYFISLDTRLTIIDHDIKTCLKALYSAVDQRHWIDQATRLSSILCRIETHHRNKLRIVQLQPYSNRGHDVKRLAALQILASLSHNTMTDINPFIISDDDLKNDQQITNTHQMFTKVNVLLQKVDVNDDTDYYELYTMIELLDAVVGAESLVPQEKVIVEKIKMMLTSLHSHIKDPRAMFMSRSKVKDLILRTVTKFAYMVQGKKGIQNQKTIMKFFVEGKSELRIETLEDSEVIEEDDEELQSQESQTSSLILDALTQTSEHSHHESQEFPR
ncbi:uncharacterized protein LOC114540913 [Dendronephthya gigantea]|uniref:uncharacterized protein LOC114540913 n=1 Tax=Dendronephthya gigantea TaxID=151771 RepID=UPI001068E618|nr:uncharacterized protein LOC114540913 [Dendronephthya gigantea]